MDNKDIKAASGRRKFLVRAGMGSLPVLMALKSKGAWGYSTQNCNLSATASKMRSVQPDQFEQCTTERFHSHGAAKKYFETGNGNGNGNHTSFGGGNERKGYYHSASPNYHNHNGKTYTYSYGDKIINETTLFSDIFWGGTGITLMEAVESGSTSLERDIAALFLHSLFYYGQGIYPEPEAFVSAYENAMMTGKTKDLALVLELYIDGQKGI